MSKDLHDLAIKGAANQAGVISRQQLLQLGFSDSQIHYFVKSRRFNRICNGIYNTVTGEPSLNALRWAAHLRCGNESYLFAESALEMFGFDVDPRAANQSRNLSPLSQADFRLKLATPRGIRDSTVHTGTSWIEAVRLKSPREKKARQGLPVEAPAHALLDVVRTMPDPENVLHLAARAMQRRVINPNDLERAMRNRRITHRRPLTNAISAFRAGHETGLEANGVRNVLTAHGLPQGESQVDLGKNGRRQIVDLYLAEYRLAIEFDGRLGHSDSSSMWKDAQRDHQALQAGIVTVRLGWHDVHNAPCQAAAVIVNLLFLNGWPGTARKCRRGDCTINT